MENLRIVLPALIALIGTLVVAYLGYRQWRRQHALTRAGSLLIEKQTAYKSIWNKLEDVNVAVRAETFTKQQFREAVKSVNVELMKSGLLLEGDEQVVVHDYLGALQAFGEKLAEVDHEEYADEVEDVALTMGNRIDAEELRELARAELRLMRSREVVLQRFRHAIGTDDI
jgi:hypothetical protein